MKKLFLTIITLTLFSISLNAANYPNSKCPQLEQGDIVYYNGVQQNVPGTMPSAFCWDALKIEGLGYYGGYWYPGEFLTTNESLADWYANYLYNIYGETHIGVYVTIVVMGYTQVVPTVKIGATIGTLIETTDIVSPIDKIHNGKVYRFFVRKIPLSQYIEDSQLDVNGYLEVYDGATLKDSTYIH